MLRLTFIIRTRKEGGSIVLTIPRRIANDLTLSGGEQMELEYYYHDKILTLRKEDGTTRPVGHD